MRSVKEWLASIDKADSEHSPSRRAELADCLVEELRELFGDDRLEQICAAEKDGRCGVCPVKLHQHIFRIFNGQILEEVVCSAIFEPFTPRPRWKIYVMGGGLPYYWYDVFGKTVFLTRPEAEAAMKGGGD